ncbi:MAG TPA: beta-ketoacyl-[acyl-carrier-protein] synthase family protein [Chthoniobacterales bacterium]
MVAVKSKRRVFVTGMGVISPLGPDAREMLDALRTGRDAVREVTGFDVSRTRCKTAGQVPDEWLRDALPVSRKNVRLHRSARMVTRALREALNQAGGAQPEKLVVATSSGGMSNGEAYYRGLLKSGSRDGFARYVANYTPQKPVLDAMKALGLRVPTQLITNACSSGSNAIGHAFHQIRHGLHDCVVCGGYDPLAELVFVGFDSLQASTPEKIRPFDRDRTGLVLGEGAALLVLESAESLDRRTVRPLAEVAGYGVSTDTFHLTQPNPSGRGTCLAMERALLSGGIEPAAVDYINCHGTATVFNDATEGAAISAVFPPRVAVSSTKSMMGHALGGAGAIEAVACVLSLQHQFLPPNINFRTPDPSWTFEVVANEARAARVAYTLSNSIGFGGVNASLLFRCL